MYIEGLTGTQAHGLPLTWQTHPSELPSHTINNLSIYIVYFMCSIQHIRYAHFDLISPQVIHAYYGKLNQCFP